jgi:hypothetical protein
VLAVCLAVAGSVKVQRHAPGWGEGTSHFLSNNELMCAEAKSAVDAESALALKKAGLQGWLYNNTFVQEGGCSDYRMEGGKDDCHPNVTVYYKHSADIQEFATLKEQALKEYAERWNLDYEKAKHVHSCICHPQSKLKTTAWMECPDVLNGMVGSFVHRDPNDGKELMCDGGPFFEATLSLATLKSTGLIMLHEHDQIVPVNCEKRGFDKKAPVIDHCFVGLHQYWRTPNPFEDEGAMTSQRLENEEVFNKSSEKSFHNFAIKHKLNGDILDVQWGGCWCSPESEIGQTQFGSKEMFKTLCAAPHKNAPIRSWFVE